MTFTCPHCQRHIECDEAWCGHQISCPVCTKDLIVPVAQGTPTASGTAAGPAVSQPSNPNAPRLAAGATQVRRPAPGVTGTRRTRPVRPRGRRTSLAGYAILAVVVLVLGWAAYSFLPGLVGQVKEIVPSNAGASGSGAGGGSGPLGEVNGAMDISDSLDGGSSATPRPRTSAAKASQTASPPATNNASKTAR